MTVPRETCPTCDRAIDQLATHMGVCPRCGKVLNLESPKDISERDCGCGLGENCPGWPTGGNDAGGIFGWDYDDD